MVTRTTMLFALAVDVNLALIRYKLTISFGGSIKELIFCMLFISNRNASHATCLPHKIIDVRTMIRVKDFYEIFSHPPSRFVKVNMYVKVQVAQK